MSGNNPHGRLGQPLNSSWNHLQVPSFIPRPPQMAHMPNAERGMMGAPPLGWPPMHSAEALYGYMAAAAAASAASSANHKTPQLDLNPLTFGRQSNNLPFGSVDLSSGNRNSLTPSPRGRMPSPVTTSTPVSSKHNDSRNANCKSPVPSDSLHMGLMNAFSQNEHMPNMGNGSILPAALLSMLAARSQAAAAAAAAAAVSTTPPPPNAAVDQLNSKHSGNASGGIFVRDATQINSDISKLASVVAAANGEHSAPKEFSDPMELIRRMTYLKQAMEAAPMAATNEEAQAPTPPPLQPPINPFQSISGNPNVPSHLTELSKSLLSMMSNGGFSAPLNLQPPAPTNTMKSPSYGNGTQPQRKSPRKNNLNNSMTTSTDDSHDDASPQCNGNGGDQRRLRYRRRKPKKTQRMSNENSMASPNGSDNMDIDDSIVKSLDESEIESNNARRTAEQLASLMSAAAAAAAAAASTKQAFGELNTSMGGIYSNDQLAETNGLNFEDMIPLSKTKIPQQRGNDANGMDANQFNSKVHMGAGSSLLNISNTLDYTKDHLEKRPDRSVDDCDIDKIAEIVAKTVSGRKNLASGMAAVGGGDTNGLLHEPNRYDEEKPHLPQAEAKVPSTSSPIPGGADIEAMFAGADQDYKSFENELSASKIDTATTDAESVNNNSQASNTKQDTNGDAANETIDQQDNNGQTNGGEKSTNASTASTSKASKKKSTKKPVKKNANKGGNGNKNKKGGKNGKNTPAKPEKKQKAKEESAAAEALSRFRGPYVQVERDGTETVINAPITEEIADKQGKLKKTLIGHNLSDRNKIRGLHVSTLSNKYDAATTDHSWMCVFCKIGPHQYGLGDLFGPYILSTSDEDFQLSQVDPADDLFRSHRTKLTMLQSRGISVAAAAKMPGAAALNGDMSPKASTSGKGRKRKVTESEAGPMSPMASPNDMPDIFYGMTKVTDDSYEVWVHEDCIVWSSGVHIIGVRIVGLEAAVWSSSRHQCVLCAQYGAILCCLQRGCAEAAHFPCAKRGGWQLNEHEFLSRCGKHLTDAKADE